MEPALRLVTSQQLGYQLHGQSISTLAYADDITIISATAPGLQAQLNLLSSWAQSCGLSFNPTKCASLSVARIPTGFTLGLTAIETADSIIKDIKTIDSSLLAPWQKIDCVNTFLTPRLTFYLTLGTVPKKKLDKVDKTLRRAVKRWLHLPQRASVEVVHMPHSQGGANVAPCNIMADIAQVSHATHLFSSRDPTVTSLALRTLQLVTEKRIRRKPSSTDLCTYLSGSMEGEFGCDPYDIPSFWTRLRMATRRLQKRINLVWRPGENDTPTLFVNGRPVSSAASSKAVTEAVKSTFLDSLLRKPDQGKTFKIISGNHNSNHFLSDGKYTRFADWRFIHRARLSVVPLRGLRRFGHASQLCRRCQKHRETLAHVINHCPPNFAQITRRHNAILDRLVNSFDHNNLEVYVNKQVPGYPGNCRPDLVVLNSSPKTATVIDVATPFENGADAFSRARSEKVNKYRELTEYLKSKGYDTFTDAFIVGALGGFDAANESTLQRLGVRRNYAKIMKRLMVSDCIRGSRVIYTNHLCGQLQRQHQ
ncbi:uncharacterized protein T26G10.4-like [Centruroides vittatus]|uniref:uncharacterized protein T26G10.4-like n=1 Tax=Centruroides vittatus TaxID=120091 RepID=UPI00350F757A